MPSHAMPCHALPCHAMPCHALPCHAMPCHTIPCHAIPYHTMPCHTMPYHTMSCYAIQNRVTPCHTMPYYTMSCYSIILPVRHATAAASRTPTHPNHMQPRPPPRSTSLLLACRTCAITLSNAACHLVSRCCHLLQVGAHTRVGKGRAGEREVGAVGEVSWASCPLRGIHCAGQHEESP